MNKKLLLVLSSSLLCLTACNGLVKPDDNDSTSDSTSSDISEPSTNTDDSSNTSDNKDPSTDTSDTTPVAPVDPYYVKSVANNKSIVDFNSNKATFMDATEKYVVGDDNNFIFKPNIKVAKQSSWDESITPESWTYELELKMLIGDEFQKVNVVDYADAAVDLTNCTINFSQAAIGHTFEFNIVPTGLTDKQKAPDKIASYTSKFSVNVEDGFNVYNANDLAYINNNAGGTIRAIGDQKAVNSLTAWNNFIDAKGMKKVSELEEAPNNFYLHKNLKLTKDNVPSEFFIKDQPQEGVNGKLIDFACIYDRDLKDNETFGINGNYFTLDASDFPVVGATGNHLDKFDINKPQTSHAQLFYFTGSKTAKTEMKNFNAIGNAKKSDVAQDDDPTAKVKGAGGLILNKTESRYHTATPDDNLRGTAPAFRFYNSNCTGWFISFFPSFDTSEYLVEKCIGRDSYNVFVYSYGGGNLIIKDSDLKGAGGPVIMQDFLRDSSKKYTMVSHSKIINSKLESLVAGTEPWFDAYVPAPLVAAIKNIGVTMQKQLGTTFITEQPGIVDGSGKPIKFFNFIALNKSGDAEAASTILDLEGTIEIQNDKDAENNVVYDYGKSDPIFRGVYEQVIADNDNYPVKPPFIQTSKGGAGMYAQVPGEGDAVQDVMLRLDGQPFNLSEAGVQEIAEAKATYQAQKNAILEALAGVPADKIPAEQQQQLALLEVGLAACDKALAMNLGNSMCLYNTGMAVVVGYGYK